ncbi:hypothetical protein HK102_003440 [Quaeritorhiza haematococci]|nr:hypothetical protein HK102_003440 [Quaeritorhiza haematococci]
MSNKTLPNCNAEIDGRPYYTEAGTVVGSFLTYPSSASSTVVCAVFTLVAGMANGYRNVITVFISLFTLSLLYSTISTYLKAQQPLGSYDCVPQTKSSPETASSETASPETSSPGTSSPGTTSPGTASPGTTTTSAPGPDSTGSTTQQLARVCQQYGYIEISFADALKDLVCDLVGISRSELEVHKDQPRVYQVDIESVSAAIGVPPDTINTLLNMDLRFPSLRSMLQRLGTDVI